MTPKKSRKGKEEKIARKLSYVTIMSRSLFARGAKKNFFFYPRAFLTPPAYAWKRGAVLEKKVSSSILQFPGDFFSYAE